MAKATDRSAIAVRYARGVHLPELDLWLDPHEPRPWAFVSHAHADHFARHATILCSERTHALIAKRYRFGNSSITALPFGSTARLGDSGFEATLIPAGHIFGSAQLHLRRIDDGATLLYTGDFKTHQGLSAEKIESRRADTLIMETTYGRPHYRFPPVDEVIGEMLHFCREAREDGEVPVLIGYSLGKAQEILKALTHAGLEVMLHKSVFEMTRIYESFHQDFPTYRLLDLEKATGHVLIVPPSAARSRALRQFKKKRLAMLTGWALQPGARFRYRVDAVFPLSDHADYPGLMRYVREVDPRRVYTLHGYAAEFARDLREQGVEAWSLLGDNQMDLGLRLGDRGSKTTETGSCGEEDRRQPSGGLGKLTAVCEAIAAAAGKREKAALLSAYLRDLPEEDASRALRFLSGRLVGPADEGRTLQTGWALLKKALLEVSGLDPGRYRELSQSQADAGRTAFLVLRGVTDPRERSLEDVEKFFHQLQEAKGPRAKTDLLVAFFRTLHPLDAKTVVQFISGELRIGLKEGLMEEALAAAFDQPKSRIRDAQMLLGNLAEVAALARRGELERAEIRPFRPLMSMLASPENSAEAIWKRLGDTESGAADFIWLEDKFDGIRCQLHRVRRRASLFSRDLRPLDEEFPEIVEAAREELTDDVILDGELIAYAEGKRLTFFDLQKRLGRKHLQSDLFFGHAVPVRFVSFDLLWHHGESLLRRPLLERRARLDGLFLPPAMERVAVTRAHSVAEIEAAIGAAVERRNEGLMAKDPRSAYLPGRRGKAWLKWKRSHLSLDVVVVRVEQGHGKRSHVLSDYTFAVRDASSGELCVIGKAYSGLTDAEIEELTEHFLANTIVKSQRAREVVPNVVLEVAFDSIHPSKRHDSGLALRFPRIKAIRRDKTVKDIDTLQDARKLAGSR